MRVPASNNSLPLPRGPGRGDTSESSRPLPPAARAPFFSAPLFEFCPIVFAYAIAA